MTTSLYDIPVTKINQETTNLSQYKNHVMLIVNTASNCGFTKQYDALEALYQEFKDRNFVVLGFPCNQFGEQEPNNEAEILSFCQVNFGVTFPLFSKVNVNGAHSHPLFTFLKTAAPGLLGSKKIKWNFTKFLVNQQGDEIKRYAPATTPEKLRQDILNLLD